MPSYPFNFAGIDAKERSSQFLELSPQLLFQDLGVAFGVADCHRPPRFGSLHSVLFLFLSRSARERLRMADISTSFERRSNACADKFNGSAARSGSFNAPGYPPAQPKRCLTGCSTKSTTFAPSATGSRRCSSVTTKARHSEDGNRERASAMGSTTSETIRLLKALDEVRSRLSKKSVVWPRGKDGVITTFRRSSWQSINMPKQRPGNHGSKWRVIAQ